MNLPRRAFVITVCASFFLHSHAATQNSKQNADFKLAINLYNDKLYDLAAEQFKQFVASYPATQEGIEARFYLGLTQLKLKQYEDARLTFQTFALSYQDNPRAPEAWWNTGESYAALKNNMEAALAFERVKVFHPKSKLAPEALLRASGYFVLAGETENARRSLRIIVQEYPKSGAVLSARTTLARMYFDEGNLEQAQNELKRVIEGDPSADAKAQALLILANIYQATQRPEQAQTTYREIIAKHKGSAAVQGAYVQLGKLLADAGRYNDAIAQFKKGLTEVETLDTALVQEALTGMGDASAASGDFPSAITYFSKFVSTYPASDRVPQVLWNAATASSKAKNYAKSNDFCNQLLKSNASDALKRRAQLTLARNAHQQRNAAQAVHLLAGFLDQYGDDRAAPKVIMLIGQLTERELRDPQRAASYYELLIAKYPHSPLVDDAYEAAARCYEQAKEFNRALQLFTELTQKYPASEYRSLAEQRITMIRTFESKEKDAGLEKLALLIGDVVSEKDRIGLAFKLGEIYFNDLKNYEAAAAQFTNAINSGMNDARFVDALFLRARSYELLTLKDQKYRQPAIDAYETFLQSYFSDPRSGAASFALFQLRSVSLSAARDAYTAALAMHPYPLHHDAMLLRLGSLQESSDSLADALATYSALASSYPDSAAAEEASFRVVHLLLKFGLTDSAAAAGTRYLNSYPAAPHTSEVLSTSADVAQQQGAPRQAAELYRQLIDDFPYTPAADSAGPKLAQAYVACGSYANAIAEYSELVLRQKTDPSTDGLPDPALLFALGNAYHLAGNSKEAKNYLFQTVRLQPTGELAGRVYNLLGIISRGEGSIELATAYFRQASAVTPETSANRDIADLLFESGDYADAAKQYAILLQTAAADSDGQYYRSRIIIAHLRNDQLGTADKEITAFVKQHKDANQDLAAFELERGNYYFRKEDYVNARKAYDRIVDKYDDTPSAPVAMYWIGKTLEVGKRTQEAIQQLTKVLDDFPDAPIIPRVHLALGNIYYNAEKWDESIRNYRYIVDDSSADKQLLPIAMSNVIESYEAAGIFDAALAYTRKYLELFPNNEDSFDKKIKIGILYQRLGYNDQSVIHLQGLLAEAGSDLEGEIRYYIAEANFNKGDYQQAILDFLKVPYLVTKKGKVDWTATSLYMSGQAYEKMGRYEQALRMYQQIIDRTGIDATFKAAAKKEIDRVHLVLKKPSN